MDQQSHRPISSDEPTIQDFRDAIAYLRRELDAATDPARIAELKEDLQEVVFDAGNFLAFEWLTDDDDDDD